MMNKDLENLTLRNSKWRVHYFLMVLMVVVILNGCQPENHRAAAIISGKVPFKDPCKIHLSELAPDQVTGIDSVLVTADGTFLLSAHPSERSFYLLQYDDDHERIVVVMNAGDTLLFTIDTNGFYKISGNEDSRLLMRYANAARQLRLTLDSIGSIVLTSRSQNDFVTIKTAADQFVDSSLKSHRKMVQEFILQNPSSLASLLLVNTYFSGSLLFPVDSFPMLYRIIADSTGQRYPANAHVMHHKNRVALMMQQREDEQKRTDQLLPGRKLPLFTLPDEDGNPVAVSSFRGRPLILFLWASWSPESRAAIQQLKTRNPAIPIVALSFDTDSNIWKAAIKIENTTWTHINDSQGMAGAAAKLFGASRHLPYFILADSSGAILASTPRFSELTGALARLE
jgi:hypothetical protein